MPKSTKEAKLRQAQMAITLPDDLIRRVRVVAPGLRMTVPEYVASLVKSGIARDMPKVLAAMSNLAEAEEPQS